MTTVRVFRLLLTVATCLATSGTARADADDLGTRLMHSTFKLTNGTTNGTVFLLSRPKADGQPQTILITAAHVVEQMVGDEVDLLTRKHGPDDSVEKVPVKIRLRQEGKPLWAKHPALDVAALAITLPKDVEPMLLSVDLLATDDMLKQYEVHPGDLLRCVGYPHSGQFESNPAGFPVARLGCVASFPLVPTKKTNGFLFDFNVFEGDSGAPVFLEEHNRFYAGKSHEGRVQLILGLISGQHMIDEQYKMIYQSGMTRHRMGLAIVVHGASIREAIELLPKPSEGNGL
ncbi:MAG TPA: trypsin-like peptidase domain-containing protein [Pirellulales bacterium]|nr:trypsin-like peptidase domain-containing protein [Pirellulales bacterium]